jgi:hypothetical protein
MPQLADHFFQLDRFTKVIVHPGTQTFFFVTFHGIGRQRDDDRLMGQVGAAR